MPAGPRQNVSDLFTAAPPALSLLTVPGVVASNQDGRWLNGIATEPDQCSVQLDPDTATADFPYWWQCVSGDGQAPEIALADLAVLGTKVIGSLPDNVSADAWQAWVGIACTAMELGLPGRLAELQAKVRRRLLSCLPSIVERELWTGQVAQWQAASTPYLMDSATVDDIGGAGYGYITAFAELEQALAECSCGRRHMIHAQPRVVALWKTEHLVELAPTRDYLVSDLGTVVVPGTGYPGTDPNDVAPSYSHSYAYGTGPVRVFLGDVTVDQGRYDNVTQSTNDAELRAEMSVLTAFDACCHVGVEINLCDALCGGGS